MDSALSTAMHTMRSATHGAIQASPGAVVFQRDMLMNIPFQADLQAIQQRCQLIVDSNLRKANNRRISHDYQVNDQVLIKEIEPDKLSERATGPYQVRQVHSNGTLTIQIKPNVTQRINIRRVKPYKAPPP